MVDFNLGSNVTGQDIVEHFRTLGSYTSIIFYSQDESNLDDLDDAKNGVFCSQRDDIFDVFTCVLDSHTRIINDPHVFRGLFIAETIDIENLIEKILQKEFSSYGKLYLEKISEWGVDFFKKARACRDLLKNLTEKLDFESNEQKEIFVNCVGKTQAIVKEIVLPRNQFAHVKAVSTNGVIELKAINTQYKDIECKPSALKERRLCLRGHKLNLEQIIGILDTLSDEDGLKLKQVD